MKVIISILLLLGPLMLLSQPLAQHRWEDRVIVLYADDPGSPLLTEQLRRFEEAAAGLEERKLVLYRVYPTGGLNPEGKDLPERQASALRDRANLGEHPFTFLLFGLDGGEKWRETRPIEVKDLFNLIDSMPMRRAEMRRKNQ